MRILLVKAVFRFFSLLPLGLNQFLGSAIGGFYRMLPTRQREVTRTNLSLCFPRMSPAQRDKLATASLLESGKTLTETGPMWLWPENRILSCIRHCHGEPSFRRAVESGKGVILAMPHLGNWELTNLYCSLHFPVTTLYRPPRLQQLEHFMCESRQRFGANLVPTNSKGIRGLYKTLGKGGLISILPDQEPGSDNGIFTPFYAVPALTMTLLSRLAQKYQAPVYFGFAQRLENSKGFDIHFIEAGMAIAQNDLAQSVALLNKGIEDCINLVPQQYQWGYKRFKTRPEGEDRIY